MIVVVADDLSGAAELAGHAAAHGWRAEVQTEIHGESPADLVALDVATRSLSPAAAARRIAPIAEQLRAARPIAVFQKIDSVLRGNVAAESTAWMSGLGYSRATIVPANPSRGRVIRDGRYFVHDKPLDQTAFADDPEHPRRSASIEQLMANDSEPPVTPATLVRPDTGVWPSSGLIVPQVATPDQIDACLAQLDSRTLAVGAADFFARWLRRFPTPVSSTAISVDHSVATRAIDAAPRLLVCGSPTAIAAGRIERCRERNVPVFTIGDAREKRPDERPDEDEALRLDLLATLFERSAAVVTLDPRANRLEELRERLLRLTRFVARFLEAAGEGAARIDVLIEGGATAAALVHALDIRRFDAAAHWSAGIAPLAPIPARPWRLLCKPGSYAWPEDLWPS